MLNLFKSLNLMRVLGIFFQAVPNGAHLDGAWAKGYDLLRALHSFIEHFSGAAQPTLSTADFQKVVDEQEAAAFADAPAPVPAQVPSPGPVSDVTVAPRAVIEA